MSEKNYSQEILDYINGKLSGKAKAAFEEALEKDSTLKEEYENALHSKDALDTLAFEEMKRFLKQENEKGKQPPNGE